MPATTWLRPNECLQPTGNKAVDETLRELRAVTGQDWRVEKHRITTGRLWWKRTRDLFCLYCHLVGDEFQIVNFYRDGTEWSINASVPADLVVAYMYGACIRRAA